MRSLDVKEISNVAGGSDSQPDLVWDDATGVWVPFVVGGGIGAAGGAASYGAGSNNPNFCGYVAATVAGTAAGIIGVVSAAGAAAVGVFGSWISGRSEAVCSQSSGSNQIFDSTYLEGSMKSPLNP
jgi:hypothetical protein